jgi:hypothetical protein
MIFVLRARLNWAWHNVFADIYQLVGSLLLRSTQKFGFRSVKEGIFLAMHQRKRLARTFIHLTNTKELA